MPDWQLPRGKDRLDRSLKPRTASGRTSSRRRLGPFRGTRGASSGAAVQRRDRHRRTFARRATRDGAEASPTGGHAARHDRSRRTLRVPRSPMRCGNAPASCPASVVTGRPSRPYSTPDRQLSRGMWPEPSLWRTREWWSVALALLESESGEAPGRWKRQAIGPHLLKAKSELELQAVGDSESIRILGV